jgi:hypothetical protein
VLALVLLPAGGQGCVVLMLSCCRGWMKAVINLPMADTCTRDKVGVVG